MMWKARQALVLIAGVSIGFGAALIGLPRTPLPDGGPPLAIDRSGMSATSTGPASDAGWVNVRSYGARGDGITDDTAAIQAALDREQMLFFPPGTYLTGRLMIPSDRTLAGTGWSSVLRLKDGVNHNLLQNATPANGNTGINIRNLRLEGNKRNNTTNGAENLAHGIAFLNARDSSISSLYITDFYLDGIYLGRSDTVDGVAIGGACANIIVQDNYLVGNQRNGISVTRGHDITIEGNHILGNNTGAEADPNTFAAGAIDIEPNLATDEVARILVQGNILKDNQYNGIQVTRNDIETFREVLINNNVVDGSARLGILVSSNTLRFVSITGNHVSSNRQAGIVVGGGTADVVVASNTIHNNGLKTGETPHALLFNGAAARIAVIGNLITDNVQSRGITASSVDDLSIVGNIVKNNSEPIVIRNTTDVVVQGNIAGDLGGAPVNRNFDTQDLALPTAPANRATPTSQAGATAAWDPPALPDGAIASTTVALPNAAVGDPVAVGFSQPVPAGALLVGAVTAPGTVTVTILNKTGSRLDLAPGGLRAAIPQH